MSETWAPVPEGSDFPFENLPFGIFRPRDEEPRVGVRIGDHVVDLVAAGIDLDLTARLVAQPADGQLGAAERCASRVAELLTGPERFDTLLPVDEVFVLMPVDVVDYIDFYSSIHHASNMGTMFRPGPEPLLPNWRQLPVAYHGRARTVVPSGTPVVRPEGLIQDGEGPAQPGADPDARHRAGGRLLRRRPADVQDRARPRRPSHLRRRAAQRLVGPGHPGVREPAARPAPGEELRHDDLAVGRHASTPFGRSSSNRPCRTPSRTRTCALPCPGGSTSTSRVELNGEQIAATNFRQMYWTFAQQLAHLTVNGAPTSAGDLFGSGTASGPTPGERGSLIELTWRGAEPLTLADGSTRTFLEDGDTVTLRGWCGGGDQPRIGFGEATGTIVGTPERA